MLVDFFGHKMYVNHKYFSLLKLYILILIKSYFIVNYDLFKYIGMLRGREVNI